MNHDTFDPNAAATADSGIFGMPHTSDKARLIYIPVPWEATTSYGGGASDGPRAIYEASKQVDLFDRDLGNFYRCGLALMNEPAGIAEANVIAKAEAQTVIQAAGVSAGNARLEAAVQAVNELSEKMNEGVYSETKKFLAQGKIVGVIGGDHSAPFGSIRAHLERYPDMGILHFDAHADLRHAYEGFEYSHASIMHNVLTKTKLAKLVQVGIRDYCEQEHDDIKGSRGRVETFFDADLAERKFAGESWAKISADIVGRLPKDVYISFDIDGLDPKLCPHTGTPVPGGLEFSEARFLIKALVLSGRRIVGFDVNEVSPGPEGDEWDANVGARLLYQLSGWAVKSRF